MKWKDERESILQRLAVIEGKLAALETRDSEPVPVSPIVPDEPDAPVAPDPDQPALDRDAELESAWSAVMNGESGVQVAIVNPNDPRYDGGPFVVEDNKEEIKGEGDNVPGALADYLDKGGRRTGDPSSLDDFEYAQAEFFCTPGNVSAPTSCRHSNQGYNCDFFRSGVTPGNGDEVGPFDTPGKAVEALREELGPNL